MRKFGLNLLSLCLFFASLAAFAEGGHDMGGGGPYEGEFQLIGERLAKSVIASKLKDEDVGFSIQSLLESISKTPVYETTNPIIVDNLPRGGANSVINEVIVFNSEIWKLLSPIQKRSFATHEFFRFVKDLNGKLVDDSRNKISAPFLVRLDNGGEMIESPSTICYMIHHSSYLGLLTWAFKESEAETEKEARADLLKQCFQERGYLNTYCFFPDAIVLCGPQDNPASMDFPYLCRLDYEGYTKGTVSGRGQSALTAARAAYKSCFRGSTSKACAAAHLTCGKTN